VSLDEALKIATVNSACASYEEKPKGSITPGKLADFVMLERDPHDVPPDKIMKIQTARTSSAARRCTRRETRKRRQQAVAASPRHNEPATPVSLRHRRLIARSALALAVTLIAGSGIAARQEPKPASEATERAKPIQSGWTFLVAGDPARAAEQANLALATAPRSIAAITLLVHADIMRAGAMTGLETYELWLGLQQTEDAYLIRHIARAWLLETTRAPDPEARLQALKHLIRDGDAEAHRQLSRLAADGGFAEMRSLAETGDAAAVRRLLEWLPQSSSKLEIIAALVASGHPQAIAPLRDLLSDPEPATVAAAADALGKLGAKETVSRIKPLVTNLASTRLVRIKAAEALYRLGDDAGLNVLEELLKNPEPALRILGAKAMSSRPTPSWQGTVRELLEASHPSIRLDAATLIAQYDPAAARAALDRLLADDMPSVRVQAARVLAERVAGDFMTLRKLMKTGDLLARVRAAGRILELTQ
jgi:HEAT repeat protein